MRLTVLYTIILLTICFYHTEKKLTLRYIGYEYKESKNKSFLNKELIFMRDEDTLRINLRLPYDAVNRTVFCRGFPHNYFLKEDKRYTFTLKEICVTEIPEIFNSYYKINTIPDTTNCSKFTEIEKDTEFSYIGNYEKYVDIDNVLYEIIDIYYEDSL